eukprot:1432536-Pyramimonas_sp.AAC.1
MLVSNTETTGISERRESSEEESRKEEGGARKETGKRRENRAGRKRTEERVQRAEDEDETGTGRMTNGRWERPQMKHNDKGEACSGGRFPRCGTSISRTDTS